MKLHIIIFDEYHHLMNTSSKIILIFLLLASVYSTCVKGLSEPLPVATGPLVRELGGPRGGGGSSSVLNSAQDLILALVARGASQKQADGVVQVCRCRQRLTGLGLDSFVAFLLQLMMNDSHRSLLRYILSS